METDQTRHETEESLMLSQFGPSPQNIAHKLQNGGQPPEADLQAPGDTNWNPYKPNTGANSMKRHSPASGQGLFDQGGYMMNGELMNGELKHALGEQSLLVHQPKRAKLDSELKGNDNMSSSLLENFPELTKASEFDFNDQHREVRLGKRNCNFPNGDIFGPPRNKNVSIPNGAISPPSTIESTPGDLLEKTLAHYYPEQVSIAPKTSGSQLGAVNGSVGNNLPGGGNQQLSLTSGLHNSAQMPDTQEEQSVASINAEASKNYGTANYIANGYNNNFGIEHQQPHHQQGPPPYSGQALPLSRHAGMMSPVNTTNSLQHQNGSQCYPNDTNSQGIHVKPRQEFTQNSFLKHDATLQTPEADGYAFFPNSGTKQMGQSEALGTGQHQHFNTDGGHQQRNQPQHMKPHGSESMGPMTPSLQQSCHSETDNRMENISKQRVNLCSPPPQRSWPEPNTSHSPHQPESGPSPHAQGQDMWRSFSARPQSGQGALSPQVHRQMLQVTPVQGLNQRTNNLQQQQQNCHPNQIHCAPAQHNTAAEWQHSNKTKTALTHQSLPPNMSEQRNFTPDRQPESHYHTQIKSEQICDDPDLQDILSPGPLPTRQEQHCLQRPLSHPPQFEVQQVKTSNYRPHSQPPPGHQQLPPLQSNRNIFGQNNNAHTQHNDDTSFSYSNAKEFHQSQNLKQYQANSGSTNHNQFQPQQQNNCHQLNNDFPQTSTQSQPHLPQGALNPQVSTQMYIKGEPQLKTSCTQFQRGPRLPSGPLSPHGDFQRHAALRTHLLQRQDRQNPSYPSQSNTDPRMGFKAIKMENEPRFEVPDLQHQEQQLHMREPGMGGIQVKQENQESMCVQSKRPGSILASMEQSLRQYQLSPVFEKKSLVINPANRVKVESSGAVTILSTNADLSGIESSTPTTPNVALKHPPDSTPKKEHLLQSFMDSPMKLMDTPIKNLLDTPIKTQYDIASCHCVEQISEKDEGPYYTHLGAAPNVPGIRELMETRSGLTGKALRLEKVIYTGKEGKSTQGCPIAKWVIRRSSAEEKVLVLVRERVGHTCETACIIIAILIWEGIQPHLADRLYLELSQTLTKHGAHTQRRCALNEERTCACQGLDPELCGASFSFGCSWSMYYNGCKFARSKIPRKFKLLGDDVKEEERLEHNFQGLATLLAPLYKTMAPDAYGNQIEHEHRAPDCRLGLKEGRPFSGVTACMDFCAHAHRDLHNMLGGSTVVCTLTKADNRDIGKIPDDEQLHVLPLYKAATTDEFGSEEGQQEKIKSGGIQVLTAFRRQVRMLSEPAKSCRQKKLEAKKANKNAMLESEKALLAKSKAAVYENTTQSTPVAGPMPGAMGATLQPGQPQHRLGAHPQQLQQQQHQRIVSPYPGSPNAANYPRFPNHPGSFPSTSKPGSLYPPQPPTPTSPYPSSLHPSHTYMNGTNHPYPGYQCNGGMPVDNYHPYYASNPKHLDLYQQRQALYTEQQYGAHQRYDVNYPPRYGDQGMQVNGYNPCNMRPVHPMRPYTPYGPNGGSELQFMDPLSRAPTVHGSLDYASAVSKGNQFGGYPNPYLSRGPPVLPPGQDPFNMQIKTEMGMPCPQMPSSQLGGGCLKPESQPGLGLPNGNILGSGIKQEPGMPQTPTTPQKPEMWSDNEHNFLDPDIGGVAVAPSHGSVLIECAKKELHATTPLKNPLRNHPTRISLVFYQHKNLNEAKHGLALWEAKMAEKAREKEEDAERNGGEGTPSKGNKKGVKREHPEPPDITVAPPYKRFIRALMEGSLSCTTNTYVSTAPYAFTKVTGPYSKFA